jgi:hypothetical protein
MRVGLVLMAVVLCVAPARAAAETRLLLGFESDADVASVECDSSAIVLDAAHVTEGAHSLRLPADDYLRFFQLRGDWSGFDALEVDIHVDLDRPVSVYVLIGDEAWRQRSTYWNRYNASFALRPGANTLAIPIGGLYRGEVGSRFNDLKTPIDASRIVRVDLGFTPAAQTVGFVYLDNMRLTRTGAPASVRAFDFGPPAQSVSPGFTPVSPDDTYFERTGWGWAPDSRPGRAWDVTFPSRLLQDSVDVQEAAFLVKLPPGRYRVVAFFEGLGYWSGEQARFTRREMFGRGWRLADTRDKWGQLDAVYHFQDTEPLPGDDLWDTYLAYLFRPLTATVSIQEGPFELHVAADGPHARRLAGLVIHPDGDAQAEAWAAGTLSRQREEFRSRAVERPLPETVGAAPITAEDQENGYVLFVPRIEDTVCFSSMPTPAQRRLHLEAFASRGEVRSLTLAIRPLVDLGRIVLSVSDLEGDGAVLPADCVTVSVVRHLPTRGLGSLMYRITPRYLQPAQEVSLPAGLTRQVWLSMRVPADAAAGPYRGRLLLRAEGREPIEMPLSLEVLPFGLDEADFLSGFFHIEHDLPLEGPARHEMQYRVFQAFRERGFNTFSGGPPIDFHGLDSQGAPLIDFSAADRFMSQARAAGFDWEINNYGGLVITGLYDIYSYTKGETGSALEESYGLAFEEIAGRVWSTVLSHAHEHDWLPFSYSLCDEPRVADLARDQLEFMRLLNGVAPDLRTTGGYSVSFEPTEDPLELELQEFFRVLDVSMLNSHDELVMAKARALGKDVYIYNQGRSRYAFGAYQWSERAKGVSGRYEWIAFIRHGYDYFDLDGREPDPRMIYFASDGLRPSLLLEQCAEGMNDFRYLQTLENIADDAAASNSPEARQAAAEAQAFLTSVANRIRLNERRHPEWLDLDEMRAGAARRIVELLALTRR